MTLADATAERFPKAHEPTLLRATILHPTDDAFTDWLQVRHNYMIQRDWYTTEHDLDEYDDNQSTRHILLSNEKDQFVMGMRLTPMDQYDQTLSWDMIADSTIQQQVQASGLLDQNRPVWDLTRLVPGAVTARQRSDAVPQLFGEGLRQCQAAGDQNPLWVFVLDQDFAKVLASRQVDVTILGSGIIGHDQAESLFGCIEPAQLAAQHATVPFARQAMEPQV